MIAYKCVDCGALREFYPSQLTGKSRRFNLPLGEYRCRPCWNKKRKSIPIKQPLPRVVATCTCGKSREITIKELQRRSGIYRCHRCAMGRRKRKAVAIVCIECGKHRYDLPPSKARRVLHESPRCASCARKGARATTWRGGKVRLACSKCGAARYVSRSRAAAATGRGRRGAYRCWPCHLANREGPENPAWRGGVSFEPYPVGWTPSLRRRIRKRDGNECAVCGGTDNGRKMPVHHIDYNKNNLRDDNLVTLCIKCHAKTNFRREHWQAQLTKVVLERLSCQLAVRQSERTETILTSLSVQTQPASSFSL